MYPFVTGSISIKHGQRVKSALKLTLVRNKTKSTRRFEVYTTARCIYCNKKYTLRQEMYTITRSIYYDCVVKLKTWQRSNLCDSLCISCLSPDVCHNHHQFGQRLNQGWQIWRKSRSDWFEMGQIHDFSFCLVCYYVREFLFRRHTIIAWALKNEPQLLSKKLFVHALTQVQIYKVQQGIF